MVKAGIDHTQATCLRLALVQDKCFGRTRRLIRRVLALIPIVIGYFVGYDKIWGILLLVLGVMIYYFTSYMYERDAEDSFRMTPEKFRKVNYNFYREDFLVAAGGEQRTVKYGEICALITDGFYYYLFINPRQAYMMELKNANRKDEKEFESYLSEQTGKKWKMVYAREPFHRAMRKRWEKKDIQ